MVGILVTEIFEESLRTVLVGVFISRTGYVTMRWNFHLDVESIRVAHLDPNQSKTRP
jgi:hypothetical protein